MDIHSIQIEEGKVRIHDFPDAAKFVVIEGEKAKRIADLYLHNIDMNFALKCIREISITSNDEDFHNEVFWRCAILHFTKCFGDSAGRFVLNRDKVYKKHGLLAKEIFDFFKSLRDKHYVHDENSCLIAMPLGVIADSKKSYNVEKIVVPAFRVALLNPESLSNLANLILAAIEWIEQQFDVVADQLTVELESFSREDLLNMKEAVYSNPNLEEAFLSRQVKGKV
jgi:hypothetical protein